MSAFWSVENPEPLQVKTNLESFAREFDESPTVTSDDLNTTIQVETPNGGVVELVMDNRENHDESHLTLESNGDYLEVQISDISMMDFNVIEKDDQYRIGLAGEENVDFGL